MTVSLARLLFSLTRTTLSLSFSLSFIISLPRSPSLPLSLSLSPPPLSLSLSLSLWPKLFNHKKMTLGNRYWRLGQCLAMIKCRDVPRGVNASLTLWRIYGEWAYECSSPWIRNDRKWSPYIRSCSQAFAVVFVVFRMLCWSHQWRMYGEWAYTNAIRHQFAMIAKWSPDIRRCL